MIKYCYFPVLKTRPSEVKAYENLNEEIKDAILPVIELTGALGYTYPKNYKIENLRGTKRPGDITKKRSKILSMVEKRRFILDITDDDSLKYYGLGETSGGLLDHSDGYKAWINFLTEESSLKKLVIPTIQFNTNYLEDVEKQIAQLNSVFDYISIKLPAFLNLNDNLSGSLIFNSSISKILDFLYEHVSGKKIIMLLDFGYVPKFDAIKGLIEKEIKQIKGIDSLKALVIVSSSYPSFVPNVPKPILITENDISELFQISIPKCDNIFHGDFAGLHPTKYEMGGGGWIPRIDYIVRDVNTNKPLCYDYCRGVKRNVSQEYYSLAKSVISADNYKKITETDCFGDFAVKQKAEGKEEGKAPSYWIAVRSNLYMTMQYLYLKQKGSFLIL